MIATTKTVKRRRVRCRNCGGLTHPAAMHGRLCSACDPSPIKSWLAAAAAKEIGR